MQPRQLENNQPVLLVPIESIERIEPVAQPMLEPIEPIEKNKAKNHQHKESS